MDSNHEEQIDKDWDANSAILGKKSSGAEKNIFIIESKRFLEVCSRSKTRPIATLPHS